ncbi:MAG: DUF1622 domain-containing protein [Lactobacillales bacterium]|jgi:uncharacterized membrane protein|nr:DUF1622 domain-containing protein [Lactobacillales bacterium]
MKESLEIFDSVFQVISFALSTFSILILVKGAVVSLWLFIKNFTGSIKCQAHSNNEIKNLFAGYVLLSLEILIGADIVESIIKPDFNDLMALGIIVVIRTVISFFLQREIAIDEKNKAA